MIRINAGTVAQALEDAGHPPAEWDRQVCDWTASGPRTTQAGPRRALVFHDGAGDEDEALTVYRRALERAGYQVTTTPEDDDRGRPRPRLEVTRA